MFYCSGFGFPQCKGVLALLSSDGWEPGFGRQRCARCGSDEGGSSVLGEPIHGALAARHFHGTSATLASDQLDLCYFASGSGGGH